MSKQPRSISAEAAARLVHSGNWLDYGGALCQPDVFDKVLAARKQELTNVKIRSCLSMRPRAVLEADPEGRHFHWFSWHFSGYDRKKHDVTPSPTDVDRAVGRLIANEIADGARSTRKPAHAPVLRLVEAVQCAGIENEDIGEATDEIDQDRAALHCRRNARLRPASGHFRQAIHWLQGE